MDKRMWDAVTRLEKFTAEEKFKSEKKGTIGHSMHLFLVDIAMVCEGVRTRDTYLRNVYDTVRGII